MNEEEIQKSHLFCDLKPTHIAIDFGRWFCQNQVPISRNHGLQPTGGQTDSVCQKAPRMWRQNSSGNAARTDRVSAAVPWSRASRFNARLCTFSVVPPFAYKYPGISRAQGRRVWRRFVGLFLLHVCSF